MELRAWQTEALPLALEHIEAGINGVTVATTGAGKSVFLAELIARYLEAHPLPNREQIVVSTPSIALVRQLAQTLRGRLGEEAVGLFFTHEKDDGRPVTVVCHASARTLAERIARRGGSVALWVADEAHKTVSPMMCDNSGTPDAVDVFRARCRHGMTATPFRADEGERLGLFDAVTYRYPPARAERDEVIVRYRSVCYPVTEKPPHLNQACIELIQGLGQDRGPGVVNAFDIKDAEAYAKELSEAGILASPIHSKMTGAQQAQAIARLKSGELSALVHVSMLVEGVDFPWLRWGCFRRAVTSKVRYIQELGRFLRCSAGKTEAVILDPNDLHSLFHVTYEEALGWVEQEDAVSVELNEEEEEEEVTEDARNRIFQQVAQRSLLEHYVRQLACAMAAEGYPLQVSEMRGTNWRKNKPTDAQVNHLRMLVGGASRLAWDHRVALGRIVDEPRLISSGMASDLIALLKGLKTLPRVIMWLPADSIEVPPDWAFVPIADPRTFVAGVRSKGSDGWSAVAIVRDGDVLFAMARGLKAGDSWTELTLKGIELARNRHAPDEIVVSDSDAADRAGVSVCLQSDNPAMRAAWAAIRKQEAINAHA